MAHDCTQEERIANLERAEGITSVRIDNLIETISSLTGWVRLLVITAIPCVLSAFGFLLAYWVKH